MVIVKLHDNSQAFTEGKELRFPEATGWGIQKLGKSRILCITKPNEKSCACDDDAPDLLASIPWPTVAMVYALDAIQASV